MSGSESNKEGTPDSGSYRTMLFEVIEGPGQGEQRYLQPGDDLLVGRAKDCGLRIKADHHLSRHHFRVQNREDDCVLVDLGSQNGTLLGRRRVEDQAQLQDGNTIEAGSSQFRVRIQHPQPSVAPKPTIHKRKIRCRECDSVVIVERATLLVDDAGQVVGKHNDGEFMCRECRLAFQTESGVQFPGYNIIDQLGEGSMGTIYLVESQKDGDYRALKILRPDVDLKSSDIQRFLREAASLQALAHRNIISYADQGYLEGEFFFVMEYVQGVDLDLYRRQAGGKISVPRCTQLMSQVLDGLDYAHRQGFVHRDIKPANVLVGVVDGHMTPKITDFGLAKRYEQIAVDPVTRGHIAFGTPDYMPPEQITRFKEADPRGDIYAVGASIYHLVSGETLYQGLDGDPIRMLLETPPPNLIERAPHVPEPVAEVVHRALEREPAARWPSAAAFRDSLLQAVRLSYH